MSFTPFTYDRHLKFLTDTLRVQLPEADLSTGSFWQIWAQGQARGLASVTSALNFTQRQILPDLARGLDLDHHGAVYDLPRLQPDRARGSVTGTAVAPYQPPTTPDLYLRDLSGKEYDIDDLDTFEVPFAGAFEVSVTAREAGATGNQVPDTPLTLVSDGAPVPAELDPEARVLKPGLAGGRDLETDPAMQARIVSTLSAGRLKDREEDYLAWALATPPVDDDGHRRSVSQVFVYQDPVAPNRVYILPLLSAPERIGPDGLAQSVFNTVESLIPVTVDPIVPRIVPIPVDVALRLKPTARARWDWYGYQRIVAGGSEPDRAIQLFVGTDADGVELKGVDGLRPGMRVLVNGEQRQIGNVDHQNQVLTLTEPLTTIPQADDVVYPGGMVTGPVQEAIRSLFDVTTPIHRVAMGQLDPVTVLESAVTDIAMEVADVHDVDDVEITGVVNTLLSTPAYQAGTLSYLAVPGEISVMPMSGA